MNDPRSDGAAAQRRLPTDLPAHHLPDPRRHDPAADLPAPGHPHASQGVYGIGTASELVGTGVQNLRAYERAGLVDPTRTAGGNRLYSPDDVARLLRIQRLLHQGLNLAGISMVLALELDNQRLREEIARERALAAGEAGTATNRPVEGPAPQLPTDRPGREAPD